MTKSRLTTGTAIAKAFDGHVTAAVVNELPDPQLTPTDLSIGIAPIDTELRDEAMMRGEELRKRAVKRLESLPGSSVVLINEFRVHAGEAMCEFARLSDIFVATLPTDSTKAELMKAVIDRVLVTAHAGPLPAARVVEHRRRNPRNGCLDGSREAARALNASLHAVETRQKGAPRPERRAVCAAGRPRRSTTGAEVLARLKHYGIEGELVRAASEGLKTADAITAQIGKLGADLLVMGAQKEGGLRQWFQSSVSRKVLADAKISLLIAH